MPPMKKSATKGASAKSATAKTPAKSAATTAPAKAAAKKSATKSAGTEARKPNAAFMKKMKLSPELAEVIGSAPRPRTEVTKDIWIYIKKHDLQDPQAKRMINADAKLKPIFGGKKQVSMFDMTKLVNAHLSDA